MEMKASKPRERPKSKKSKQKKKSQKSGPWDVSKQYSLPLSVVEEIRKAVPDYRSHGRGLQVATEFLVRMDPLPAPDPEPGERRARPIGYRNAPPTSSKSWPRRTTTTTARRSSAPA